MTIKELYEHAKSIGAENCNLTILCTEYDEGDATASPCFFTPYVGDFTHYKNNNELLIDVR